MKNFVFRNRPHLIWAVVLIAFFSPSALATIWIVDANNGPGTNFTTISAAIAAAQPGDRIIVRAGTYGETVIVNKGVTIVGANATTYPMTVPADPFANAIWGGLAVQNIPLGQTCVISGIVVARPTVAGGISLGVLNSLGPVVLDRIILPNGGLFINNSTDVILQDVRVRHFTGATPPTAGVEIANSWVQASDLDATGGDLGGEPDSFVAAGNALEVHSNSTVALARPKLIGGFGGGPWITSAFTPAGGCAIRCMGSVVSIVDDVGSLSYLIGGQGGHRGAGSVLTIPSGDGGNTIEVVANGSVLNKKPMPVFPGTAGPNASGGLQGSAGSPFITASNGSYAPVSDLPALYGNIANSVPGGFWLFVHHAAAPGFPIILAAMQEYDLNLYPPSVQFLCGNPASTIAYTTGMADATGFFTFGFGFAPSMPGVEGLSFVVQSADNNFGTLFLANPGVFVFGF